ncbi:yeats family-domain-containing protein [Syncephalis plumigaleata]|nr:yeats family-domain-containing protein [Syncephalis plumigaleata]
MSSRIIRKKIHVITRNDVLTDREFFADQFPWRKWQIALFEAEQGRISLHEDFDRPNRCVTQSPFKVEEIGWGGFEMPISIFFHGNVRPFTFVHDLNFDYSVYESSVELVMIISNRIDYCSR